jgi:hypothetical protein
VLFAARGVMLAAVPDISGWFLKIRQVLRALRSKIEGRIANPSLLFAATVDNFSHSRGLL